MNETLILLLIGFLGVVIHSLMKAQSLQTDAEKANVEFDFKDTYLKKDYLGIIISFLQVLLWLLIVPEVSQKYVWLQNWIRVSFAAVSFLGSYLIQMALSKAKKYIRTEVDIKTNELSDLKKENV